jgi:uncharacterized protein YegP (UPF0339 family)
MQKATFQVYKNTRGRWRARLVLQNGEIIAPTQSYARKEDALKSREHMVLYATIATIKVFDRDPRLKKKA